MFLFGYYAKKTNSSTRSVFPIFGHSYYIKRGEGLTRKMKYTIIDRRTKNCRYQGYDNERSLAMHRISKAETLSHSFIRPKDFDLEQYDNDGRFGFGEGNRVRLSFTISKGAGLHLLESPLSTDQVVKEFHDKYQIQATVVESAQLHWWLRGFGDQVSNVKLSKEYKVSGRA